MNKFRKILTTRKGFTLMELIIVLVIIAILAAALMPSFLNFVSRARQDSLRAEARVGMVAAQFMITRNGAAPQAPASGSTYATIGAFQDALVATGEFTATSITNYFRDLVLNDVTIHAAVADTVEGFSNITVDTNRMRVTGITFNNGRDPAVTISG